MAIASAPLSPHAHADPDIACDSVVGIRERKTIAIDRNAISWSGLARNGNIGRYNNTRVYVDNAADCKDNIAIWLAHSIAEEPGPLSARFVTM